MCNHFLAFPRYLPVLGFSNHRANYICSKVLNPFKIWRIEFLSGINGRVAVGFVLLKWEAKINSYSAGSKQTPDKPKLESQAGRQHHHHGWLVLA